MKTALIATTLAVSTAMASASARELEITVTNLSTAVYFTPLIVTVHDGSLDFFEPGMPASFSLQQMAEGGDLSGLAADAEAAGADTVLDPAGGTLAPGTSVRAVVPITEAGNRYLSVAGMLLPTNDGFVAADAVAVPRRPGTYVYELLAWDAGTESNDEIVNGGGAPGVPGIPADPGGNAGAGGSGVIGVEPNPTVHIHPGIVGDLDPVGGISDLDSRIHRFLNPVARLEVKVSCGSGGELAASHFCR